MLVEEMDGTSLRIAKDVKLQVEVGSVTLTHTLMTPTGEDIGRIQISFETR